MIDASKIPSLSYVNFTKKSSGNVIFTGILISSSRNFVCIKEFYEFNFVGYNFLSTLEINTISLDENNQILKKICIDEAWAEIKNGFEFIKEVSNWKQLCQACFDNGVYISCENNQEIIFIGRIVDIGEHGISLISIRADFVYMRVPITIMYKDIVGIVLLSKYVEVYEKYSH